MILNSTNRVLPSSPSQPSPVGASAFTRQGPTRSGWGLRGTHPLSQSPEVQRSVVNVDKSDDRQRSRCGHRINTVSDMRFVSCRLVSENLPSWYATRQYYGGQNATGHIQALQYAETQRHHKAQIFDEIKQKSNRDLHDSTCDSYCDVMKEKARCQLRLEPIVHERLKAVASRSDLSLNQLVEGILAWAGTNAHYGIPRPREDQSHIETTPVSQVLWFGHDGAVRDEKGEITDIDGPSQISFMLDFRATRAMVDGWEVENGE